MCVWGGQVGRGEGTQAVLSEVVLGSAFLTGEHPQEWGGVRGALVHPWVLTTTLGGVLFLSPFQR